VVQVSQLAYIPDPSKPRVNPVMSGFEGMCDGPFDINQCGEQNSEVVDPGKDIKVDGIRQGVTLSPDVAAIVSQNVFKYSY